jgi:hypothetical protein
MQFFDANGNPLVGGKLYSYASGTSTPLATYTDSTGSAANTNPIILDSRGECNLWLGAANYTLTLKSATDVLIWSVDGVSGTFDSSSVSYTAAGTGAVTTTVQAKLRQTVSVQDFGAVGDGVTDDTLAIQAAIDALSAAGVGGTVLLPAGAYKITQNLSITWPNSTNQNTPGRITIKGEGADLSYIYDYRSDASAATGGAITIDFTTGYDNKFFTMYFGEFSLIKKFNATTYSGGYTIGVGTGLYMKNIPCIGEFNDIRIIGYNTGVVMSDCLGVTVANFNVQLADLGFVVSKSTFSEPTMTQFNNCTVAGIKSVAYVIVGGGPIVFNGGVIELCGVMSGSSQGVSGGIYYQATDFLPTQLVLESVYFEGNGGNADVYIDVQSGMAARAVSNISNCMFARNSATLFVTNNIYVANNSSTATLVLNTIGNGFKGYSPYTASSLRLYISDGGSNVSGITIYGLGNFYDDATETPTVVVNVTGGGSGSQNLQSVTTLGATTTVNSTFNGVNIGTYSGTPSITNTGTTIGIGNATNAVALVSAAWRGAGNNTNDLGASGVNWNNIYGTTYRIGSGTATITASGNNINLNGVASAVAATGFAPVTTDTYYLGGSTLKWNSLYLGTGNFDWNGYAIAAPSGSTVTFLRNDGTWATPGGSGIGTVTNVATGTGLTGGPITSTGTISLNLASVNTWTGKQTFNGEFQTNTVGTVSGVGFSPVTNNVYYCGGSTLRWAGVYTTALNATGAFTWNSYAIAAPTGGTTTFLRNDGTWAVPAGGGGGSQDLQSVTTLGATTTVNSTFNGVNIGTYSTIPSITTTGSTIGVANGSYAVGLTGSAWLGSGNNTNSLGASGTNWANVYATTYNVGAGSATLTASGSNLVLNGVASAVAATGFAPAGDNAYFLGGSSLRWSSLYLGTGAFNWNSYAISAPAGSTTTFLRNDGTWATPSVGATTNSVTFNSGGSGGGSGSTFNGASALTVSYNTIGAPSTGGTGATGTWGISVSGTSTGLSGSPSITVSGVTVGSASSAVGSSGTNTTLGGNTVFVAPSTGLAPSADNSYVLGGPSNRWTTVYATTGTINTSDARQKQQDRPLSEAERAVAVRVKGLIKTFKFNEAVAAKGDGARIHIGVYAQELADAFAAEGLDATHYGMFCYDELEGTEIYGVRYEELLAFVIAVL